MFPDASENGEEGGRGIGDDGVNGCECECDCKCERESCTVGSESWRCMRRSVWRLFWNHTVTERMSLCVVVDVSTGCVCVYDACDNAFWKEGCTYIYTAGQR